MSISSFEYYYSLNEVNEIEIDQIENLKDQKLFVSVGGGIGAGKTYITKKFINLPIIDVDNFITEVGKGKYDRINLAEGRTAFNNALLKAIDENESFVHMGTNANLNGAKNRLELAKKNGFMNVLVLVDTNPEKAFQQIQIREERKEISKERIIQSYIDSKQVFETLIKDNKLVDFYVNYKK
jgi:dephospho-CoA kinase